MAGSDQRGGLAGPLAEIINGTLQPPERDPGFDSGEILDQGRDDSYAAYDYLAAMIANGRLPDCADDFLTKEPPYPRAAHTRAVHPARDLIDGVEVPVRQTGRAGRKASDGAPGLVH